MRGEPQAGEGWALMGVYFLLACPDRREFIDASAIGGHDKLWGQGPALWAMLAYAYEGPWRGRAVRVVHDLDAGSGGWWDAVHGDGEGSGYKDVSAEAWALAKELCLPPDWTAKEMPPKL